MYGLTEETAKEFKDIPLNDLAGVAAYKIPVLHVISLQDKMYRPRKHVSAHRSLTGRPGYGILHESRRTDLEGHHFPIEHPERWADFIQEHSYPVQKVLNRDRYLEQNNGVGTALSKFQNKKEGTVAFLGGSITHNPGWRNKTMQYLEERFPDTKFTFIAAGIPSLGSTPHAFRFGRDVLAQGTPDLLFVESAVNDRGNDRETQVRALDGIMQQAYAANPALSVVLMAFAEPHKNNDYEAGKEPTEVAVHRQVADHYGAAFINLSQEVYDRIKAGELSWKYDFKDLHPSAYGQELYYQSIRELLEKTNPENTSAAGKLPEPMDAFSYSKAHYVELEEAVPTKGFMIDPVWEPYPKLATRPGFVKVPMLVGENVGDSFELEFTGRGVGIAVVSGPDAGILSYRIDGKKARTMDLFTQWSKQLHLPWYLMLDDTLKPGKHTLKVTITDKNNPASDGYACRIVYFLVNE